MSSENNNNNKPVIKLYGDLLSQPTRAVLWVLVLNKIQHEFKYISIAKGEQRTEEFKKVTPFQKLPCIEYNGLVIAESHTILRFIAQEFKLDSLYNPHDLIERTKVDTYLDWHHLGLRRYASTVFFLNFVAPIMNIPVNQDILKDAAANLPKALKQIEDIFLKNGDNKYIIGDHYTIADFSCYNEINELLLIKYDLTPYPILSEWMKRMEQIDGYKESNKVLLHVLSTGKLN